MNLLVLVGLLACGGAEEDPASATDAHALEAGVFRFCHEPGVDAELAMAWCDRLDEIPEERCPGLHATCAGAEPVPSSGCNDDGAARDGERGSLADGPEKPREPWSFETSMPDLAFVGQILQWVMALVVAGGIALLARYLWMRFGRRQPDAAPEAVVIDAVVDEAELDEALPEVPSAPSSDLLAMARQALDEGRAGEAVVLARGAALRRLGETGRLRLHRSRTDREYVRLLQAGSEEAVGDDGAMSAQLRVVTAMVEVFRFGRRAPPADAARDALLAAERILKALVVLLCCVSGVAHGQGAERYGPDGDAALHELFTQRGYDVRWRITPLDAIEAGETDALFLDVVGVGPTAEEWQAISLWVEGGGVLMVVGDASPGFPELGLHTGGSPVLTVLPPLSGFGLEPPALPDAPAVYAASGGEVWVEDADGAGVVVVLRRGSGVVVALADLRFAENGAFVVPANEALVGDLLYLGQSVDGWPLPTPARVHLATRTSVASEDQANNPLESLARAELLPFVLQFLVLWLVLAAWRGWPFGPLKDPPEAGRTRFADHVEAIGDRYRRLRASRHALRAYASLWLQRLGASGLELAAMDSGMTREQAARWVAEIEALVAEGDGEAANTGRDASHDFERMEALWTMVEHRAKGSA